jgi:hypothetical protein
MVGRPAKNFFSCTDSGLNKHVRCLMHKTAVNQSNLKKKRSNYYKIFRVGRVTGNIDLFLLLLSEEKHHQQNNKLLHETTRHLSVEGT